MTVYKFITEHLTDEFRIVYEYKTVYDSRRTNADVPKYIAESIIQSVIYYTDDVATIEI